MLKATSATEKSKADLPMESNIYYEVTESGGAFGVAIKDRESKEVVFSIEDIARSLCDIERFVSLCNRLGLSRIHFLDAVDDFIG